MGLQKTARSRRVDPAIVPEYNERGLPDYRLSGYILRAELSTNCI